MVPPFPTIPDTGQTMVSILRAGFVLSQLARCYLCGEDTIVTIETINREATSRCLGCRTKSAVVLGDIPE